MYFYFKRVANLTQFLATSETTPVRFAVGIVVLCLVALNVLWLGWNKRYIWKTFYLGNVLCALFCCTTFTISCSSTVALLKVNLFKKLVFCYYHWQPPLRRFRLVLYVYYELMGHANILSTSSTSLFNHASTRRAQRASSEWVNTVH